MADEKKTGTEEPKADAKSDPAAELAATKEKLAQVEKARETAVKRAENAEARAKELEDELSKAGERIEELEGAAMVAETIEGDADESAGRVMVRNITDRPIHTSLGKIKPVNKAEGQNGIGPAAPGEVALLEEKGLAERV